MWRFFGFVALVIAGLAAVFYYKGQAEDNKVVQQAARKDQQRLIVSSPLAEAKAPQVKTSRPPEGTTIGNFGTPIIIQGELKPKEEQEVTFEVENMAASIEQLVKDIGSDVKPGDLLVKVEDKMMKSRLEAQKIQAGDLSTAKIKSAENAVDLYTKETRRGEKLVKDVP